MRAFLALTVLALALALPLALGQGEPGPTGEGATIAVLDTGVDSAHPELSGRVTRQSFAEPGFPFPVPGGAAFPFPEDPSGQGTAVASLAAGRTLGLAPGARLLDLQVSAKYTGQTAIDPVTEDAAIEAMDALLRDPGRANIVLLSFAQAGISDTGGRTLSEQARGLWNAGVLVVVPSGPTANPLSTAPHVVTVAGIDQCPSPMGPSLKPDLVADSSDLEAAQPGNGAQAGGTSSVSGTAYAAAQVAGAAALLLEIQPLLPVDALAAFLRDAAAVAGEPGLDKCTGFGELDADAAVLWARTWRDPLASGDARGTPGFGLPLVLVGLVAAVLVGRRHG